MWVTWPETRKRETCPGLSLSQKSLWVIKRILAVLAHLQEFFKFGRFGRVVYAGLDLAGGRAATSFRKIDRNCRAFSLGAPHINDAVMVLYDLVNDRKT